MNRQDVLTRIVLFNANTRNAWLAKQACRVALLEFANFLFCGDRFLLWPRALECQSNAQGAKHIRNVIGDSMS